MEKNLLLSVFTLWKPIFFKIITKKIGFKSKNEQDFVTNLGYHHVNWQGFQSLCKPSQMNFCMCITYMLLPNVIFHLLVICRFGKYM